MILFSLLLAAHLASDDFPFVIQWDDSSHGVATDAAFLNRKPAGANGRIVARNGQFVESETGRRVRFFGTNIAGPEAFPSHSDAIRIAAHLAKMGINIVRLHHLQNPWGVATGGSVWKAGRVYEDLDPGALDRLDYFIFALKQNGIYSNVNLQTTRTYLPEMGFPQSVLKIPTDFCKKIDKIDPHMIELQQQYAKDLLDRLNPYTGLKYADDPAIAVIEINNENSLVGWPEETPGAQLDDMPEPFKGEIVSAWNRWLAQHYRDTASLEAAWKAGATPAGASLVNEESAWTTENQSQGDVQFESGSGTAQSAPTLTATIRSNPGPDWHVQAHVTGLTFHAGDTYTVRFTASSDQDTTFSLEATLDVSDWHNLGLSQSFDVGPETKDCSVSFIARDPMDGHNRLTFVLGAARGRILIDHFRVTPGIPGSVLAAGTSLEDRNIPLPEGATKNQDRDYVRFLADAETAYSTEMRNYLRRDLGIKANLIDTQISWGGLTALQRERDSDFADNHAYWQHPSFPGKAWDMNNWHIDNTPMVNLMDSTGGELGSLALNRVAGKPYSVSEYNHPAPSDYRVEMMPEYASMAALQDWDAIYTFEYGVTGSGAANDRFTSFFDCALDPDKSPFFPSAAMIFREGLIPPLADQAVLNVSGPHPWEQALHASEGWRIQGDPNVLRQRTSVAWNSPESENALAVGGHAETQPGSGGLIYKAYGPAALAVAGFVGGQTVSVPGVDLAFPSFDLNFAGLTLVAEDAEPLARSSRLLLTVAGKAENQNMIWNANRTSLGANWGHGPVEVEGIPCDVTFASEGPRRVWALDATGHRGRSIPVSFQGGKVFFTVGPEDQTVWYEIAT